MSLSPDQKLAAYFLGRRIAGQRRKQDRVPVAYLYNGVRLPGLPKEWDRETYPYAFIWEGTGYYELCIASVESVIVSPNNLTVLPSERGTIYLEFICKTEQWEETRYSGTEYTGYLASVPPKLVWSNFDFKYKGTDNVYFAASEPVPVYE